MALGGAAQPVQDLVHDLPAPGTGPDEARRQTLRVPPQGDGIGYVLRVGHVSLPSTPEITEETSCHAVLFAASSRRPAAVSE
ncbi:hypothetical protein GCM10009801_59070 [Streptomyces albiaxialis]|uniref:Uncharacterized protein n=1 Tax=Streptomyces albiaxialis TaxID=329523 RepID=A0ABN2WIK0_9ACTN